MKRQLFETIATGDSSPDTSAKRGRVGDCNDEDPRVLAYASRLRWVAEAMRHKIPLLGYQCATAALRHTLAGSGSPCTLAEGDRVALTERAMGPAEARRTLDSWLAGNAPTPAFRAQAMRDWRACRVAGERQMVAWLRGWMQRDWRDAEATYTWARKQLTGCAMEEPVQGAECEEVAPRAFEDGKAAGGASNGDKAVSGASTWCGAFNGDDAAGGASDGDHAACSAASFVYVGEFVVHHEQRASVRHLHTLAERWATARHDAELVVDGGIQVLPPVYRALPSFPTLQLPYTAQYTREPQTDAQIDAQLSELPLAVRAALDPLFARLPPPTVAAAACASGPWPPLFERVCSPWLDDAETTGARALRVGALRAHLQTLPTTAATHPEEEEEEKEDDKKRSDAKARHRHEAEVHHFEAWCAGELAPHFSTFPWMPRRDRSPEWERFAMGPTVRLGRAAYALWRAAVMGAWPKAPAALADLVLAYRNVAVCANPERFIGYRLPAPPVSDVIAALAVSDGNAALSVYERYSKPSLRPT